VENQFRYRVFLMYLDLAELPTLFRDRWLWSADSVNLAYFHRRDHLGDPQVPQDRAVRDLVEEKTGVRPTGPIRLLTHLRYFGYCFNPVSFYYCYDPAAAEVETIVATSGFQRFEHPKAMHVSPFMPMDIWYDWRFKEPGESLNVHFTNYLKGARVFDATLTLRRREISPHNLARVLLAYPPMTLKVITMIHWQALRLWLKGATFYVHPKKGRSKVSR